MNNLSSNYLVTAVAELMRVTNYLELIGDFIETDLILLTGKCLSQNIQISEASLEVILQHHRKKCGSCSFVRDIKTEVRLQISAAEEPPAQRLAAHEPRLTTDKCCRNLTDRNAE